ncbi:NrdR family transcriptional regulator [Ligilactobacillus salitolerans]|uniref:Transcriptional repressor NrdR n=1 Tax=Ligilactobacillus salitolerans TaxID=1808352 RepID=A0A401IVU0_9LACO|nr:transcriptional regulator NrdR [Ligilactobacillus salitolerans]GBG95639.1 NrdR family transcriptional regulator [Ligilactobacillus salitolerans]
MMCPHCHHNSSRVVDSRPADSGHAIRRRRECENCGYRFTTFERIEVTPLLVIKKNGTREEFDRDKILRGVMRAAEKRPVGMDKLTSIVDDVENKVRALGGTEVSSQLIGKYVMDELVEVDDIAYIRFASVYREFKDMGSFVSELNELMSREKDDTDTSEPDSTEDQGKGSIQ